MPNQQINQSMYLYLCVLSVTHLISLHQQTPTGESHTDHLQNKTADPKDGMIGYTYSTAQYIHGGIYLMQLQQNLNVSMHQNSAR